MKLKYQYGFFSLICFAGALHCESFWGSVACVLLGWIFRDEYTEKKWP